MTRKEALEAAAVMVAYGEGKTIQWHDHDDPPDDWSLCKQGDPLAFDWACFDYCIKPEPPDESSSEQATVRCKVRVTSQGEWEWCDADTGFWHSMSVFIFCQNLAYIEDQHGNKRREWPLGWCHNDFPSKCETFVSFDEEDLSNWHPAVPVAIHFWKEEKK